MAAQIKKVLHKVTVEVNESKIMSPPTSSSVGIGKSLASGMMIIAAFHGMLIAEVCEIDLCAAVVRSWLGGSFYGNSVHDMSGRIRCEPLLSGLDSGRMT